MYKERYNRLVEAISDDVYVMDFVEDQMQSFVTYVKVVYEMSISLQMLRFRLEGDDYREAVARLDRKRRDAHESAIASCDILKRLAEQNNVQSLYGGDTNDRYAVADFCAAIVDEMFKEEVGVHGKN